MSRVTGLIVISVCQSGANPKRTAEHDQEQAGRGIGDNDTTPRGIPCDKRRLSEVRKRVCPNCYVGRRPAAQSTRH